MKSSTSQPYKEMEIKITICYFTLARKVYYKKNVLSKILNVKKTIMKGSNVHCSENVMYTNYEHQYVRTQKSKNRTAI